MGHWHRLPREVVSAGWEGGNVLKARLDGALGQPDLVGGNQPMVRDWSSVVFKVLST